MTKTLTKQWRDGTLPDGYYYIDYDTQQRIFEIEDGCATYQGLPAETYFLNDVCLIKVLAPVPSYDEWKKLDDELKELATKNDTLAMKNGKLQKQLRMATKALNDILNDGDDYWDKDKAQEALTKMKGVK